MTDDLPDGIGVDPDSIVAERAGLDADRVRYLRQIHGIPAAVPPGRPRRTALPEGIGSEPDDVVALREGLTRQAIQYLRNANEIPPASEPWRSRWFMARDSEEWGGDF